jgi:hypothetical protein
MSHFLNSVSFENGFGKTGKRPVFPLNPGLLFQSKSFEKAPKKY